MKSSYSTQAWMIRRPAEKDEKAWRIVTTVGADAVSGTAGRGTGDAH